MKILFIGPKKGNSYLHFLALKRTYKKVDIINSEDVFVFPFVSKKIFYHISPYIFQFYINYFILSKIHNNYDLIYVRSGEIIGKNLLLKLKKKAKKIVYFCNDNPFVKRDNKRWKLFLDAAKYYDKIAFQDKARLKPSKKWGIKKPLLVLPPYDKKIHKRHEISSNEKKKFKNDLVFIGTWSPNKGLFLKKIIELGIDVKIYGNRWDKDPNFEYIKHKVILGNVLNPNYSKIIQSSKIALCLFSEENLDTITARSIEIPAIGTLLFSLRTESMKEIFVENKEAIFFKTPKECVKKIKYYLKNNKISKKIAKKANFKITKILRPTHEELIKKILLNL
tara:strand:+ start:49 stop:1056 length:1008 start_codon:yes stop_codon:yes gene_type:complete